MKKQLIVMCGVPASGKSTVSSSLQEKTGYKLISRDKVREELGEFNYNKEGHAKVREAFHDKIRGALFNGESVIADATHLTKHSRASLIEIAKEFDCDCTAVCFDVDWETLNERNSKRTGKEKVPNEVLHNMYLDYQLPSDSEGFKKVHTIKL